MASFFGRLVVLKLNGWARLVPIIVQSVPSTMNTNAVDRKHGLYVLGRPWIVLEVDDGVFALETPPDLHGAISNVYHSHLDSVEPGTWITKRLEWSEVKGCISLLYECMVDVGAAVAPPAEEDFGPANFALVEVSKGVATAGKTTSCGFDVHVDNGAVVSGPVWTAIVYMECTADGGELEIFADEDDNFPPIATIPCRGMVVMRGNVPHRPAPIEAIGGAGVRGAVIFQLPALSLR